jgi:hypothetical protein
MSILFEGCRKSDNRCLFLWTISQTDITTTGKRKAMLRATSYTVMVDSTARSIHPHVLTMSHRGAPCLNCVRAKRGKIHTQRKERKTLIPDVHLDHGLHAVRRSSKSSG